MREVVLDTETTGLDPAEGHRIIEICCVELDNHLPTGKVFHRYVHPERDIPEESSRVHGITLDALAAAPVFSGIAEELLAFIGDSPLVIHNAEFDLKFLNAEFSRAGLAVLPAGRGIDTIALAKRRFPGSRFSLDELCRRFNVDLSGREKHGARIDAELLAQVYLELIGGRQARLELMPEDSRDLSVGAIVRAVKPRLIALVPRLTEEERAAHAEFVAMELGSGALWNLSPQTT